MRTRVIGPPLPAWGIFLAGVLLLLVRTAWICDDAYITFRTADNWVNGYGLRWNVAERVQAFSHPLWLLIFTPAYLVVRDPYTAALILQVVISASVFALYAGRVAATYALALAGVMTLVCSRAFVDYSTSGLENPVSHLLLLGLVLAYRRVPHGCSAETVVFLAAMCLVNRLDLAPLVVPVAFAGWVGAGLRQKALPVAFASLPLVAWLVVSTIYYGFPFPNTAYAKIGTGIPSDDLRRQGVEYLRDSFETDPIVLVVITAAIIAAAFPQRDRDAGPPAWPLALGIAFQLFYVVRVGGDFMSGRFLVAPFLVAVSLLTWRSWRFEKSVAGALSAAAIVCLATTKAGTVAALTGGRADPRTAIEANGIADERAFYYMYTGLWPLLKEGRRMDHPWAAQGRDLRRKNRPIVVWHTNAGFFGFAAGPRVHVMDCHALAEPLLARLPVDTPWRIGHFARRVPLGYPETLATGRIRIADPGLASFYRRLEMIVRGPLWESRRWRIMARMNLNLDDDLLDGHPIDPQPCGTVPRGSVE